MYHQVESAVTSLAQLQQHGNIHVITKQEPGALGENTVHIMHQPGELGDGSIHISHHSEIQDSIQVTEQIDSTGDKLTESWQWPACLETSVIIY